VTAGGAPQASGPGEWDGGWHAHREAQLDAWCRATPAQRLAWLEQAMELAREAILRDRGPTVTRW